MELREADPRDWPAIQGLLLEGGLPLDGAADAFTSGVVAVDADRVVGCAAIEAFEGSVLLRSVAVAPSVRRTGIGTSLVRGAETLARARGAREVYLLTETAVSWFDGLGYRTITRSTVPLDVAGSIEFESACSSTAIAMSRTLDDDGRSVGGYGG